MRAISMERTSRTVIEATTSSRLSFSLTLLRRMSRIGTAGPPSCLGLGYAPALCCPGVDPRSEQARTIHELHDRLQVDPRRGLGRGMADARRSRRLLPPDRQIRHDRPHLQPHHRAHSRRQGSPADQPLRHALQGDHGVEPGEDRRRGRDRLETRDRLRHQQIGLRDPRRHPQGASGRRLRAAHPYPRRHRGIGDEMRAAAAVADRDPVRRPYRLSRLRGAGGGARRARAHRQRSRSARCAGHAQPRPAHLRRDHPAGVKHHVSARIVLPLAGRRHGGAHRVRDAGRERARAYRAPLSARHAPPLWRAGMAGDAAPARGRGPPLGLSAVLALRLALALAAILPTALSIGLLLGAVPASAGSPSRYQDYDQGAYLPYVNAPGPSADIVASPLLRVSFGGRSYAAVMDTGSTCVVVSADKIPNIASLQSLGPGQLTYSSSGRIMIGRWVVTPMTIAGGDGTRITTERIAVLAVTRVECMPRARRCTPNPAPRGISMLGVGFGRRHDHQAQSGPEKNPFLNIATLKGNAANGARMRRGYVVTRRGVHIGLTAASTDGDFAYIKLAATPDERDWAGAPACISVNGAKPAACGSLLMDTGVTAMYLTVPESQAPAELRTFNNVGPTLVAGTKLTISIPAEDSPQALYTFTVGDDLNPLAPRKLNLVGGSRPPFVNTSLRFLNGFDYLYDAEGGFVGLRWTGRVPQSFGRVVSPSN